MIASFSSWWSPPPTAPTPSPVNFPAPFRLKDEQTVLITEIFDTPPNSNCVSLKSRCHILNQSGTGFAVSNFFKSPPKTSFLEIFQNNISINTVSFYGAPQWEGCTWLSSIQGNMNGLLSVEIDHPEKSTFYPFPGMSSNFIPILVPSCSKKGEKGSICVFETDIVKLGVSLWDINAKPPKQIFRQSDLNDTRFMDNRFLLGLDAKNQLVCWDLEDGKLRYSISGWIQDGNTLPSFGPYFYKQKIQFASNGRWIYAFNLNERKLAYKFMLPENSNNGAYHMSSVGDKYIFFREVSSHKLYVFDVVSGAHVCDFEIGGGVNDIDTDNYPSCTYNGLIAALALDRKTVHFYDPANGNVTKTFSPTNEYITGLHCTQERVIANCMCTAEVQPKEYVDQVYIWDISAKNQEPKIITPPDGYGLSPLDITNGQLTLYLYSNLTRQSRKQNQFDTDKKNPKTQNEKSFKKMVSYASREDDFQWTDPNPLMLDDNKIRLEIWDTTSCKLKKELNEEFKPSYDVTFAKYEKRRLMVDANSVIVQGSD